MNIQSINTAILNGTWTNAELMSMTDAVKFARKRLTERNKATLMLGDTVNFTSTRTGRNVTGTVVKIAIKYVTVRTLEGLWKVPANMLNKVDEDEFA
jgi:small-conductance mechanosensitive channel